MISQSGLIEKFLMILIEKSRSKNLLYLMGTLQVSDVFS